MSGDAGEEVAMDRDARPIIGAKANRPRRASGAGIGSARGDDQNSFRSIVHSSQSLVTAMVYSPEGTSLTKLVYARGCWS